jgi:hypothetical protein
LRFGSEELVLVFEVEVLFGSGVGDGRVGLEGFYFLVLLDYF